MSQNCALSSQIFFSLSCSLCFWGEKKLKNVHNLQYALEHSVFENTKAKCEGVSFPTTGTDFVVCCNGAEHISKVLRSVEILPAPPLGGIFFCFSFSLVLSVSLSHCCQAQAPLLVCGELCRRHTAEAGIQVTAGAAG